MKLPAMNVMMHAIVSSVARRFVEEGWIEPSDLGLAEDVEALVEETEAPKKSTKRTPAAKPAKAAPKTAPKKPKQALKCTVDVEETYEGYVGFVGASDVDNERLVSLLNSNGGGLATKGRAKIKWEEDDEMPGIWAVTEDSGAATKILLVAAEAANFNLTIDLPEDEEIEEEIEEEEDEEVEEEAPAPKRATSTKKRSSGRKPR